MELLRKSTQQLLAQIPHLSDEQRKYWLEKIKSLSAENLKSLNKILAEENKNFQTAFFGELKKNQTAMDDFEIDQLKKHLTLDLIKDQAETEQKEAEKSLENLLKKL